MLKAVKFKIKRDLPQRWSLMTILTNDNSRGEDKQVRELARKHSESSHLFVDFCAVKMVQDRRIT